MSDRLAVALIPWYIANRDAVECSRAMLRIWAGGVHSQHGRYAELLAKLGAEVRTYTTEAKGKKYKRYLVVIRGRLYEDVVNTLRNQKRLRKLANRHFGILVEAFRYYSPRGLKGDETVKELKRLLGARLTKRLLDTLKSVLRGEHISSNNWPRKWLRELFRVGRGYGFMRKVYACVEELKLRYEDLPGKKRPSIDELKSMCIEMILEATHAKRRQTANKR